MDCASFGLERGRRPGEREALRMSSCSTSIVGRVEEGRGCWAMRRRPVSLPHSSNRTCPIKASGFPTDFIVGLTAAVQFARGRDAARRGPRRLSHGETVGRRALAPCAVERGSSGRGHRHDDRRPDRPASTRHSRNTPTNRSEAGSVERAPSATRSTDNSLGGIFLHW